MNRPRMTIEMGPTCGDPFIIKDADGNLLNLPVTAVTVTLKNGEVTKATLELERVAVKAKVAKVRKVTR